MLFSNANIQFFRDVLDKCKHVTTLWVLADSLSVCPERIAEFFSLMNTKFIDRLTKIFINTNFFDLKDRDNKSLTLSIFSCDVSKMLELINLLLQKYNLSERNPEIYTKTYISEEDVDIATMLSKYIKEQSLENGEPQLIFPNSFG